MPGPSHRKLSAHHRRSRRLGEEAQCRPRPHRLELHNRKGPHQNGASLSEANEPKTAAKSQNLCAEELVTSMVPVIRMILIIRIMRGMAPMIRAAPEGACPPLVSSVNCDRDGQPAFSRDRFPLDPRSSKLKRSIGCDSVESHPSRTL